jgi:hypothetical protein
MCAVLLPLFAAGFAIADVNYGGSTGTPNAMHQP